MAFSDLFKNINVFGVSTPKYLEKLTTPEYGNLLSMEDINQAKRDSLIRGLLTTGAAYAAQPKNLGAGSVAPYLGKAYMMGMESAKTPFNTLASSVTNDLKFKELADANKAKETRAANIAELEASDPRFKGLSQLPTAVQDKVLETRYTAQFKEPGELDLKREYVDLASRQDPLNATETARLQTLQGLFEKKPDSVTVSPTITVDTGKKEMEGFSKQVYDQVADDEQRKAVITARDSLDKYKKLQGILEDEDFIRGGPIFSTREAFARIADFVGVGGETNEERLSNTRLLVQEFAQAQLRAGADLKGPPSEKEQDLLRRASLGEFDKMTPDEIKTVVTAAQKAARTRIVEYNEQIDNLIALQDQRLKANPDNINAKELKFLLNRQRVFLPVQVTNIRLKK